MYGYAVPMKNIYLVCTDSDKNANKYYEMLAPSVGSDTFTVNYGRVTGVNGHNRFNTGRSATWDISQWSLKYLEKLEKGYTDISDVYYGKAKTVDFTENKVIYEGDTVADKLLVTLRNLTDIYLTRHYSVGIAHVTDEMIRLAYEVLGNMKVCAQKGDVEGFNRQMCQLFMTLPRQIDNVRMEKATVDTFDRFIEREKQILDTCAGTFVANQKITSKENLAKSLGLSIRRANLEEQEKIKGMIEEGRFNGNSSRFVRAWKVTNKATEKAYKDCVKDRGLKGTERLLWHGSRSENFYHILSNGLDTAHASSGMFSAPQSGIYFAPKFGKSLGYTDLAGARWTGGSSKTAYIALYEVALGKPMIVYERSGSVGYMTYDRLGEYDSLYASSAKGMLANDEVVIYRNDQSTIRYLVEISL